MFKSLVVVICVSQFYSCSTAERVAVPFKKDLTKVILNAMKECIIKTGAPPNSIDVIRSGKVLEDEKFKEFYYCTCLETGFVYPDGHMKVKECIELFPEDVQPKIAKIVKVCAKEEGVNKYDTIFKFIKCFQEKSPVRVSLA